MCGAWLFPRSAQCTPRLAKSCRRETWMAPGRISIRSDRFHVITSNRQPRRPPSIPRISTRRSRRSRPTWDGMSPAARSPRAKNSPEENVPGSKKKRDIAHIDRRHKADAGIGQSSICATSRLRALLVLLDGGDIRLECRRIVSLRQSYGDLVADRAKGWVDMVRMDSQGIRRLVPPEDVNRPGQ